MNWFDKWLAFIMGAPGIIVLINLLIGKYLKTQPWFANKLIPLVTFLVGLIGFKLVPSDAYAGVGLIDSTVGGFLLAVGQTIMTTGVHSLSKNTLIPLLKDLGMFILRLRKGGNESV